MDDTTQLQTEPQTALERVKLALEACPHPRGLNWTPHLADTGRTHPDTGAPILEPRIRNPVVELFADDLGEVCDLVPLDRCDEIVRDLTRGVKTLRGKQPPLPVYIHVDDAHHIADLAEAREPPLHNRFKAGPQPRVKRAVPTIGEAQTAAAKAWRERQLQRLGRQLPPDEPPASAPVPAVVPPPLTPAGAVVS